jgi:hypothetical protein
MNEYPMNVGNKGAQGIPLCLLLYTLQTSSGINQYKVLAASKGYCYQYAYEQNGEDS